MRQERNKAVPKGMFDKFNQWISWDILLAVNGMSDDDVPNRFFAPYTHV